MHKEILTEEQIKLLPLLEKMKNRFGLVGGTAIALHLGHRRSIDFDLCTIEPLEKANIAKSVKLLTSIDRVLVDKEGEFTFFSSGVKVTFFHYPFNLEFRDKLDEIIKLPDLLTLAAMKAYALGKRAKWKDYIDLYFIIKNHHSVGNIAEHGRKIFGNEFNEKIFRTQLSYFADIDYSEEVEFLPGFEVKPEEIKNELIRFSLN